MNDSHLSSITLPEFYLWKKLENKHVPLSFELELTARCINNCRHCYINLPAGDRNAVNTELSFSDLREIVDQAVSLGPLWCLVTGGEPLLREDFFDIYLYLKKKGLLISVFTSAVLVSDEHIRFFKKYPPRDIEVTVYGVTPETYERITRKPGSFNAFRRGLDRLLESGIEVRLKTMAMRSNIAELPAIAEFCQKHTKDYFRFDPFLHLRFDGNQQRNAEIISERLFPQEIVSLEQSDINRFKALEKNCGLLIRPEFANYTCNHLFHCGTGTGNFTISSDGCFHLCSSLRHPACVYDLKCGNLRDAWQNFVPYVRDMRSDRKEYLERCRLCPLINLCLWCPAHAHLETGEIDMPAEYFCSVAHARAASLGWKSCNESTCSM